MSNHAPFRSFSLSPPRSSKRVVARAKTVTKIAPTAANAPTPQKKGERDFLGILDLKDDLLSVLDLAQDLKRAHALGKETPFLRGKTLGMIFEKPSTRTRVSFEVGMTKLAGAAVYMNSHDLQLGRGESIEDTALALSRFVDVLVYRAFRNSDVVELAKHATIPVINGLDDVEHPCQIVADLLTIREHKGTLKGLTVAYVGDGDNNVAHSLLLGCAIAGIDFVCASPKSYGPSPHYVEQGADVAKRNGSTVRLAASPEEAVKDADAVVTDTWVSMGDESDKAKRLKAFANYTVTESLMKRAKPDALFLHCLPAYYGHEVAKEVAHGPQSVMWDEAENRMWAQMAILCRLLGQK